MISQSRQVSAYTRKYGSELQGKERDKGEEGLSGLNEEPCSVNTHELNAESHIAGCMEQNEHAGIQL